jgi:acyl-CoA thioesterase-1
LRKAQHVMAGLAISVVLGSAAQAEQATIAALGDSLTQGYGLPVEEGFVPQLQRWLQDHGTDAQVLNAGVSGDTTAGGLARLDWTLAPEVDALIVALGANDMLRGIEPSETRANLDAILAGAKERDLPVLLIGVAAASNYGPAYKSGFDAIYPELADRYGAILVPDFFAPLRQLSSEPRAQQTYLQPDGLHPTGKGVSVIVEAIGPKVAELVGRVVP